MRLALITAVLVLALAGGALADSRGHGRSAPRYDFSLNLNYDPLFSDPLLGSPNDRPGYRAFIPQGLSGAQLSYSSPGYRGGRPGRVYTPHYNNYSRHSFGSGSYYYRRGAYTVYPDYGYPGYSAPTYIFPGRSPVVIDPSGSYDYALPQDYGQAYSDNRYYDQRSYDNSQVNNYYAPQPAPVQRAQPVRPPVGPLQPKADPIGPQKPEAPVQPRVESSGTRFYDSVRLSTPSGPRDFRLAGGALYTKADGSETKIASGVDSDFGGYAVVTTEGSAVVFRQDGKLAAAVPGPNGWTVQALPRQVDFGRGVEFKIMAGTPWVMFDATDGTRWIFKLSGQHWAEVGSGSR